MKLKDYLKYNIFILIVFILGLSFCDVFLSVYMVDSLLLIYLNLIVIGIAIAIILYDYYRRKNYYKKVQENLDDLEIKYLLGNLVTKPEFIDGLIMYNILKTITKDTNSYISSISYNQKEFIEYLEAWVHEIKTPLASANLVISNNHSEVVDSIEEELIKIDNFVEQILYYVRSGSVEKDYLIKSINLKEVISTSLKLNKKELLSKHFRIELFEEDVFVRSDSKWLLFIINQIISNSLKYTKDNPVLSFKTIHNKNQIILEITDNGVGIKEEDLPRVFDKGFTGNNGRVKTKATGIGLYICKELVKKLNHEIIVESKEGEYTTVKLIFPLINRNL
ncbi:MAG: ATP-binding protein [Thomasclavelia sp.]|nr:ATP-binding protein [Thomasclavelia sp.]